MWSTCELACSQINGPLVIECRLEKSRAVLYHVLTELGIDRGYHLLCDFTRNIPVGKGLSSSTADMLATLRAIQEVFGFIISETFISKIFTEIEPHDGLHFNSSVIYNHRAGRLIENFRYVPHFSIIAIDNGGIVDTIVYNQQIAFTEQITRRFDALMARLRNAFAGRDDRQIAECATESARIHLERTGDALLDEVLSGCHEFSPLGIIATHSGTCAGFLYERDIDSREIQRLAQDIQSAFGKHVFVVRTLRLLA